MLVNLTQITGFSLEQNLTSNWALTGFSYLNATLYAYLANFSISSTSVTETISLIPSFGPKTDPSGFEIL